MSKMNKIWMWIFIAMFAIPEILWSPIVNFYYELSQTSLSGGTHPLRNNFLQISDNLWYLKFVIFFQLVGLLLFLVYLVKNRKNIKLVYYLFSLILSLIILMLTAFALYFAISFDLLIF
jgi:hypothetical protein